MRIGIFGGSFDPIHHGHLTLAKSALRELKLDRVYFVPAKRSPFKMDCILSPIRHRLKMIRIAIGKNQKFKISGAEMNRSHPSYSYQTVRYFKRRFHESELFFILGDDSLKDFRKWKNYREIAMNCILVVGKRGGQEAFLNSGDFRMVLLKSPMAEVSSTAIRKSIEDGKKKSLGCPSSVINYIFKNHLFSAGVA